MADISGINSGDTLSFSLHTSVLPDVYKNVKVLAADVSYEVAMGFDDVAAKHANIISTLPEGTPNDPSAYPYLYVETIDGQRICVGSTWIKEPIEKVTACTIEATINNVGTGDVEKIRKALNGYGYTEITITVKSKTSLESL